MISRGSIEKSMIVSSEDGSLWATSHEDGTIVTLKSTDCTNKSTIDPAGSGGYFLREYTAVIMQEDGSEKEEKVNEATNLLQCMDPKIAKGWLDSWIF
jgi:hypothetical protein